MTKGEGEGEGRAGAAPRKGRSRLRRVTVWTAKGLGRAAWGGVKLLGRALWWSARAGWRAGRNFERRRREKKQAAEGAQPANPKER